MISTSVIETLAGDGDWVSINDQVVGRLTDVPGASFETTVIEIPMTEFNAYGQAVNIDGQRTERLPNSVIPSKILEYIDLRYSEQYIVEWEKDKHDQQVQLSNGTELIFDLEGTFIRMDD